MLGCRFLVDSERAGKACKMEIKEIRMTLQRVLPPGMQPADGKAGIGISFAPDQDGYQIIQSMAPQGSAAASGKVTATHTTARRDPRLSAACAPNMGNRDRGWSHCGWGCSQERMRPCFTPALHAARG